MSKSRICVPLLLCLVVMGLVAFSCCHLAMADPADEHNWENSMPEIAQCVKCFRKVEGDLGRKVVKNKTLENSNNK